MRAHVAEARGITLATAWRMVRDLGVVAVLAGLMSGCAARSGAPPPTTPPGAGERYKGAWRAVLNFCEHGR